MPLSLCLPSWRLHISSVLCLSLKSSKALAQLDDLRPERRDLILQLEHLTNALCVDPGLA